MVGACDLHIHAGPDIAPCQHDLLEVVQKASDAGMRAHGIKDHNTTTADRVALAKTVVPDCITLIGGIVLNYAVGGFNLEAVDKPLNLGARIVCMPLFDRQHPKEIVKMMTEVGMDRCLIFSDFGQPVNPTPVEGYKMFLASLLALGVGEKDLHQVASVNPARLLSLD